MNAALLGAALLLLPAAGRGAAGAAESLREVRVDVWARRRALAVDAVLEVPGLRVGAVQLVRRIGNIRILQPRALTGLAPAEEVPAPVELGGDRLQALVSIRVGVLDWLVEEAVLFRDELLDSVAYPRLVGHCLDDTGSDQEPSR